MHKPQICICPVKKLYLLLKTEEVGACAAVISSSMAIEESRLVGMHYVFRQYEDIDFESPNRSFSEADAAKFAAFIKSLPSEVDTLYCCCDAGESRSPAVAAAICRYFGKSDSHIWSNPHYHPNMLVFDLLAAALGINVSDEEKDGLLYQNRMAFKKALGK